MLTYLWKIGRRLKLLALKQDGEEGQHEVIHGFFAGGKKTTPIPMSMASKLRTPVRSILNIKQFSMTRDQMVVR